MKKKVLSILLVICMVVGLLPTTVFAVTEGEGSDEGFCPHHQEHTAECGYAPATQTSTPCNHTHNGECGYTVTTSGVACNHIHHPLECYIYDCTHECDCDGSDPNCPNCGGAYYFHDENCGYGSGADFGDYECGHDAVCGFDTGCILENCSHQHGEGCTYVAEVGEGCTHTHDAACGYAESSEGEPCKYDCVPCKVQEMIEQLPEPDEVTEENKDAVQAQLDAIEEAKGEIAWESLAEDDTMDVQKVVAVQDALDALDEAEPPEPPQYGYKDPVENIDVSNATYYDSGALKSIDTEFDWSAEVNPATSRLVLMTSYLGSNDFSEMGKYGIFGNPNFPSFGDVLTYDSTHHTFGIIASSGERYLTPGSTDNQLSFTFTEGNIPLDVDKLYYIYLWTYYSGVYYPDHLFCVISVRDGAVTYTPATGRNTYDASAFQQVESKTEYKVTVVPGEHMTKTAESGAAEQTGLSGAMTDVVYTADEGYIFPEDYAVAPVTGITVTRDSETQITVSGIPTADTEITLTAPSEDSDEHSHCICGKTHRAIDGHSAESVQTWQPLNITSGTLSSGSYYLEDNVILTGTVSISGTVNLCLNGKTLNGNGISTILDVDSGDTLNIVDCVGTGTITGASSGGSGSAAIYAYGGNVNLFGGSIASNTATSYGNIHLDGGAVFIMNGGAVRNNSLTSTTTDYAGGGFYVRSATLIMNGGSISSNTTACGHGGGIYCTSYATVYINGGTITGNAAAEKGDGIFYSSRSGNDGKLYIGGAPSIADEIYLDNTGADKYPYITSAIRTNLLLVVASFEEGRVVAEGSGYTLTKTDLTRITLKDASGNSYYCKLDSENNQIIMTATDPGYSTETYLVIYDGNGGEGSTADSNEYEVGATATILNSSFTLSGHGFAGWNTAADGSGTPYAPGDEVEITADLILYAQWEEGEYTATFVVEDGEAPAAQVVSYEDKLTKPEEPTVEGMNFLGWLYKFESDSDWSTEYWDFENDVVTENVTLKADFEAEEAQNALEFSYAYDVQRSPAFPVKGRDFTVSGLSKPYGSDGSTSVDNEGEWVLTLEGLYKDFKSTEAHSSNTASVVRSAASAYGVEMDSLLIYKLTNNEHYAYGVLVMHDPETGVALFCADNRSGSGTGYLFSKEERTTGFTIQPETDATDQVGGYNITVAATSNGIASVSQAKAPEGTEITITANADSGYELDAISVKDASGADVTVTNQKFVMPDSDVTVTVTFKAISVFTITVARTTHGTVVSSVGEAAAGARISLTISPDVDYELDSLVVEDADGNEIDVDSNHFIMPASDVTVTVTFKRSYIQPDYTVTIPENVEVELNDLTTVWGKIMVTITKLDPSEWIKVEIVTDGELNNEDDDDKVIPYKVKSGNDDFTFAIYEQSGETELSINITHEDWNKAYSGSYSDTVNFNISCVAKTNND